MYIYTYKHGPATTASLDYHCSEDVSVGGNINVHIFLCIAVAHAFALCICRSIICMSGQSSFVFFLTVFLTKGFYSFNGDCTQCTKGKYKNMISNDACQTCAVDTYNAGTR